MPIYEYKCSQCGETFEAFQKITDSPLSECKFCHGIVEKLISQTSFQLKGSGWYLTDYAKKSQSGESSKTASDSSNPGEKSGASGEKENSKSSKSEKPST